MTLHGTGCCLIDYLYAKTDFSSPAFAAARSRTPGDGGLSPGKLVFAEDFERFAGKPYASALAELVGGAEPDTRNLGGPSVVALAHAAQLRAGTGDRIRFFGARGNDETGRLAAESLERLPFDAAELATLTGPTPRTDVLSDPGYDGGHGERTFINLIGAAGEYGPENLPTDFYDADLLALGGTALVPRMHDGMGSVLRRASLRGVPTVVNLVYDFRAEQARPNKKWRLGIDDDAYPYIDLLIADREEAVRTAGVPDPAGAVDRFLELGVGAVVVTDGRRDVRLASGGGLFAPLARRSMPVCEAVNEELAAHPERRGDTTGCGDNFAGGLLASMLQQLSSARRGRLDLAEACVWAGASGGFACFTVGGTYYESRPGEKRERLAPYLNAYRAQLAGAKP